MEKEKQAFNFSTALSGIEELWQLKEAAISDHHAFKLIKFEGEFSWHTHDEDKVLIVLDGKMSIDFTDSDRVSLSAGDSYIVPKHVEHKPIAHGVCGILLIERVSLRGCN